MALLDGLETVLREDRGKAVSQLCETILAWWKKKKLSTEEFIKLQLCYINSRWSNTKSEDHPKLCKGAGNADIVLSVARLAVDEDIDRSDDEERYDADPISRQWISRQLLKVTQDATSKCLDAIENAVLALTKKIDSLTNWRQSKTI